MTKPQDFFQKKKAPKCRCAANKNVYIHEYDITKTHALKLKSLYPELEGKFEYKYDYWYSNSDTDEVDVLVLMEWMEPPSKLFYLREKFLHQFFGDVKFGLMPALGCTPNFKKKVDDTVQTYSMCKDLNMKKRIAKHKPKTIMTIGRALYSITETKDLKPNHFFVPVNKDGWLPFMDDDAFLYSPEFNCNVYPIPGLYQFLNDNEDSGINEKDVYEWKFVLSQIGRIKSNLKEGPKRKPCEIEVHYIDNKEDTDKILNEFMINGIKELAIDTESTGLKYFDDDLISIQFAYSEYESYFCHWKYIDIQKLQKLLDDKFLIFQNAPHDMKFLKTHGIKEIMCDFDTMLASHQCNENSPNGLKSLSWIYTRYGGYEEELKHEMKSKKIKSFGDVPLHILVKYAGYDPAVTFQLYEYFKSRLEQEDPSVKDNFYNYVMPAVNMIVDVEMNGVPIDMKYLFDYNDKLKNMLKETEELIYKIAGKVFNTNSDQQKTKVLESLPGFINTLAELKDENPDVSFRSGKTNDLLLNKTTFPLYEKKGIEIIRLIKLANHYSKEISQLGLAEFDRSKKKNQSVKKALFEVPSDDNSIITEEGYMNSVHIHKDGSYRLHGGYKMYGTDTGRASGGSDKSMEASVKTVKKGTFGINFQNVPAKEEFRKMFLAPKDFVMGTCDYDGMEVSIFSQSSGPGVLEDLIINDKDMHSLTGVNVVDTLGKNFLLRLYNKNIDQEKLPLTDQFEISRYIEDLLINFNYDYFVANKKKDVFIKVIRNAAKIVNWQCLSYSTRIRTNMGDIMIGEFVPEKQSGDHMKYEGNLKLIDRKGGEKEFSHTFFKNESEILDIELENGDILSVTPDHVMLVVIDGHECRVLAKDLKDGDDLVSV